MACIACWALWVRPGATPVMLAMLPTVIDVAVTPTSVAPPLLEELQLSVVAPPPPPAPPPPLDAPPPPVPLPDAVAAPGVAGPPPFEVFWAAAPFVPPPFEAVAVPLALALPSAVFRASPVRREPQAPPTRDTATSSDSTAVRRWCTRRRPPIVRVMPSLRRSVPGARATWRRAWFRRRARWSPAPGTPPG